jgi:hypothetical protein
MCDLGEWVGLDGYSADQWQAFGTMLTALVAVVAAVFAWLQVRHARKLRDEQAQPNVVVDFEAYRSILMNLVVKNTGLTVAYDVRLTFDPPLVSTLDANREQKLAESLFITRGIPTMPPGRTWTALFERGPDRYKRDDLPRSYSVTVAYRDSRGREYVVPYRLDLDIFFGIRNVGVRDVHDVAEALRSIKSTVDRWTDLRHGLAVVTRDGDAIDARDRAEMEALRGQDPDSVTTWDEISLASDWRQAQFLGEDQGPPKVASESIVRRFKERRRRRGSGDL